MSVITDSDASVETDYLRSMARTFAPSDIGAMTNLYRGVAGGDFWSKLEALGMSTEFMAGVVTANRLEGMKFALGPSMAIRRDCLNRIGGFKRTHEAVPEPGWCLLEQGFLCSGPATRGGCGALCLKANLPCRGCYGPSGAAEDQGMAMIGAIGSILDAATEARARELVAQVVDPVGTLYRFSLASSHLKGGRAEGSGGT